MWWLGILTAYLKGKTHVEPDCVTQLLGTLDIGTLESASLKDALDPNITEISTNICFMFPFIADD